MARSCPAVMSRAGVIAFRLRRLGVPSARLGPWASQGVFRPGGPYAAEAIRAIALSGDLRESHMRIRAMSSHASASYLYAVMMRHAMGLVRPNQAQGHGELTPQISQAPGSHGFQDCLGQTCSSHDVRTLDKAGFSRYRCRGLLQGPSGRSGQVYQMSRLEIGY